MVRAADARPFIARVQLTFAKSVPHKPHEYAVEQKWGGADFDQFAALINKEGRPGQFEGARYRYLTVDGFDDWTSRIPIPKWQDHQPPSSPRR